MVVINYPTELPCSLGERWCTARVHHLHLPQRSQVPRRDRDGNAATGLSRVSAPVGTSSGARLCART